MNSKLFFWILFLTIGIAIVMMMIVPACTDASMEAVSSDDRSEAIMDSYLYEQSTRGQLHSAPTTPSTSDARRPLGLSSRRPTANRAGE